MNIQHIMMRLDNNIDIKDKVLLYLDILVKILDLKIKFKRTSPKPLVLHAIYFKPNEFKDFCKELIKIFNFDDSTIIEWGSPKVTKSFKKKGDKRAKSKYIRDAERAKKLHDSFIHHLSSIRSNIENCNDMEDLIKCKIDNLMEWMGIDYDNIDIVNIDSNVTSHDHSRTDNHSFVVSQSLLSVCFSFFF